MYNSQTHIDPNAKNALELRRQEQETRKLTLIREQKQKELKQLETQLFYRKQEIARITSLFNRAKRDAVVKQQASLNEKRDVVQDERQIQDIENRLKKLELEISQKVKDVTEKISEEKALIMEHERELLVFEKQKRDIEIKATHEKNNFIESLSRLTFNKKHEGQESKRADDLFKTNQQQVKSFEDSLKVFTQEATVLENKVKTLRNSIR